MPSTGDSTILEPPFHRTLQSESTDPGRRHGPCESKPVALRGHERILIHGRCPVGSELGLAEQLGGGGCVVSIGGSATGPDAIGALPIDRRPGPLTAALRPGERGSFDLVIARGLPTPGVDPAALVAELVHAARPGGRIALFEDRFPTLSPWPRIPGFAAAWRQYEETFAPLPDGGPAVGLVEWLAAADVSGVRSGIVASGGTAGDPRFEGLADHVRGRLEEACHVPWVDGIDAAIASLDAWRVRSDAALMALTRYAQAQRAPIRGFFTLTP